MDFFRSVFSEDPSPPSSPKSDHTLKTDPTSQTPNPKITTISNAWTFGSSFFKTIATKSESVIENYRRDLEEFSSGLREETSIIRLSASRAVKDLPARLESGAALAQTSLESVGQAIDALGSTVSDIIIHSKDSIFNAADDESDGEVLESNSNIDRQNIKPYSRTDAVIRAMQCDMKTYCEEPDEVGDYREWKMEFVLERKRGEIEKLLEENGVIGEIYHEVVPALVDQQTFWSRYFYGVYRIKKAEEARSKLVKRAIEGQEEEELSWDIDEEGESKDELKRETEKNAKTLELERGKDVKDTLPEVKNGGEIEEKGDMEGRLDENDFSTDKLGSLSDDKASSEGRSDNVSDFSIVSSQPSSREGEDLGWDEIEDIGSGDESKTVTRDLRKRLSAAEDEEDLTWDIEDDEEHVKS